MLSKYLHNLVNISPSKEWRIDWHTMNTAAQIGMDTVKTLYYNDPPGFDKARKKGKAVGLAFCYGGTWFMVKRAYPGITDKEAQTIEKNFFSNLPVFKKYLDKLLKEATEVSYVKTFVGRHIPIFGLDSDNWMLKNEAKNGVYNYPIQGGGGELIRVIMIDVGKWVEENRLYTLQGNLICDTFATRVVSIPQHKAYEPVGDNGLDLEQILDTCPDGNTLVLITNEDGTEVKAEYDRSVKIDMSTLLLFDAKVVF